MEKILSITIPSFNVEKYIGECLDSLICSKYIDLIEIIVINDGSNDSTAQIVENKYIQKYNQSIRLINKKNGGHGSTINVGISSANGKYFKIIDGDDWVDTKEFDLMIEYLLKTDCDLILTNYNRVFPNRIEKKIMNKLGKYNIIYSIKDFLKTNSECDMASSIIKTKLLKENNIKIDEKTYYVDTEYIYYSLAYINSVSYIDSCVYQYRLGNPNQSVTVKNFTKNFDDHQKVIKGLLNLFDNEKLSKEFKAYLNYKIADELAKEYTVSFQTNESKLLRKKVKKMDNLIKEYIGNIDQYIPKSKSIKIARSFNGLLFSLVQFLFKIRRRNEN